MTFRSILGIGADERPVPWNMPTEGISLDRHHRMDSYFCMPQAPWQNGTVENTHGRVRRFLSRDVDIATLPEEALIEICDRLNGTPRKCLGYRTPKEVLMSSLDPGLPGLCNPDQLRPGSP